MTLSAGTRVGPYEIVSPLGAGGMGEVYRARDARLSRDVALKVISLEGQADPERLRRFAQEVRAVAAISHPNVVVIHDSGTHEGTPYLVAELLEGETLAEVAQRGPVPTRRALELAAQIARGLAATHEKGIVHRDLKSANLFLTKAGQVKLLDFGLAKVSPATAARTDTLTDGTVVGAVLGSPGYMAPEQVRGLPADHRSDIFSLGVVLYELLAGKRPFTGETRLDVGYATLHSEPPEIAGLSAPIARVVRGCLEKAPEARFQSARDLALTFEALAPESSAPSVPLPRSRARSSRWLVLVAVAAVLGGVAASLMRGAPQPTAEYTRVNFRRGMVTAARLTPDGAAVVFSGAFEGEPERVFLATPGRPEARAVSEPGSRLWAVSSASELALAVSGERGTTGGLFNSLSRAPLAGGAPRQVADSVISADWSPDGARLAVAFSEPNTTDQSTRIEYPLGTVLHVSPTERVSDLRVAPRGELVAFISYLQFGHTDGRVMLAGPGRSARALTGPLKDVAGLAWSPDGRELWFAASPTSHRRSLWAVSLEGQQRRVLEAPGSLVLYDIGKDGRVLLAREDYGGRVAGVVPTRPGIANLSWLDSTWIYDLTPDGKSLLFEEQGQSSEQNSVWVRHLDGAKPPVKLAEGIPFAISADGQWVLEAETAKGSQLILVPTGPGPARPLQAHELEEVSRASFFADGTRLLISGRAAGRPERLWVQALDGGTPLPVSPEGVWGWRLPPSPDGRSVIGMSDRRSPVLIDLQSGSATSLKIDAGMVPVQWTEDGQGLYLKEASNPIFVKYDLKTHAHVPWDVLQPVSDLAGVTFFRALMSRDGKTIIYGYHHDIVELYVASGLR